MLAAARSVEKKKKKGRWRKEGVIAGSLLAPGDGAESPRVAESKGTAGQVVHLQGARVHEKGRERAGGATEGERGRAGKRSLGFHICAKNRKLAAPRAHERAGAMQANNDSQSS